MAVRWQKVLCSIAAATLLLCPEAIAHPVKRLPAPVRPTQVKATPSPASVAPSPQIAAPLDSPLAPDIFASFVTHAPGSNVPVGLYKDTACTQPALHAGDIVKGWRDDLATGTLVLSNSSTSTCTLQYVNGYPILRLAGNPGDAFQIALSGTYALNNADIWVRYRVRNSSRAGETQILEGVTAGNWSGTAGQNTFWLATENLAGANGSTAIPSGNRAPQIEMVTEHLLARSGTVTLFANGLAISPPSAGFSNGGITYLLLGGFYYPSPPTVLNGGLGLPLSPIDLEAVVLGNNLSATQITSIDTSLTPSLQPATVPIVCTGDSITQGFLGDYNTSPPDDYPDQLERCLPGEFVVNDGHWGWSIANPIGGGVLSSIAPFTDSLLQGQGIQVVEIGTNDLANGTAISTVESALWSYCDARRANGATVFVCTLLPRDGSMSVSGTTFETNRETLNSRILADYAAHADGIVDIGADPQIGWSGTGPNPADSTTFYNADQTHPDAAGMKILAHDVFVVLASFLPTPYHQWNAAQFSLQQQADPTLSGATASPAGDAIPNLLKYSQGMNALVNSTYGLPSQGRALVNGTDSLTFTFTKVDAATDITYHPEWSSDLLNWSGTGLAGQILSDDGFTQQVNESLPAGPSPIFFRLRVTDP